MTLSHGHSQGPLSSHPYHDNCLPNISCLSETFTILKNVVLYLQTHICFQTLTLSRTTFFSFTPHQHHNQNESSSTAIGCSTSSSPAYGCSLTWFFNVFARARNVISQIFHWAEFPPNFTLSANFLLMRRISKSNKDKNWIVLSLICSFGSSQSN